MNISSGKKVKAHPHLVICYICGRNFSSASFPIHEPNCIKKYQLENPGKPVPKKPVIGGGDDETPVGGGKMTAQQINKYNEACREQFLDQGREACPNCGRKFLPDRLPIHLRSCTPDGHFAREAQKRREKLAAAQEKKSNPTTTTTKPNITNVAPKIVKPKPIANNDTVSPVKVSPTTTKAPAAAAASKPAGCAKFCSECGNKFGEKDKFCSECGTARA
ncbi:hypothetical protein BCR32DRAFT_274866 [Anaeromyces robustus]|uniref:C2HC/C3H-type domain-containing protein n=1 Tax=Anaeromyces robustus TaxID=1754192 RepID=A0A1Y1XMW9_9FUNG|nr:hypothetical protein BCR32DRAFT_274866 [Anaeromyces robustus]|eukprot:ORX87078.1 hypothetical protein BCR32DRAFT_274866 [Anaeromyces robustus]